jgi:hypothetical protein
VVHTKAPAATWEGECAEVSSYRGSEGAMLSWRSRRGGGDDSVPIFARWRSLPLSLSTPRADLRDRDDDTAPQVETEAQPRSRFSFLVPSFLRRKSGQQTAQAQSSGASAAEQEVPAVNHMLASSGWGGGWGNERVATPPDSPLPMLNHQSGNAAPATPSSPRHELPARRPSPRATSPPIAHQGSPEVGTYGMHPHVTRDHPRANPIAPEQSVLGVDARGRGQDCEACEALPVPHGDGQTADPSTHSKNAGRQSPKEEGKTEEKKCPIASEQHAVPPERPRSAILKLRHPNVATKQERHRFQNIVLIVCARDHILMLTIAF